MGGNQKDSKLRIVAEYMKNKSDNTEFLIREYKRGGRGLTIDGQPFSMWFDTDGITIGSGRRAVGISGGDFYTWSEVDKPIRALLDEGSYLPKAELNKAWNFVRHELAERIWCFYRDNHDIEMPAKWKMGKHSVFDDVNLVELDLYDFTRIAVVAANLETDMETAEKVTNSSLPDEIRELAVNPIFFTEKEIPAEPPQFITDDEIDAFFIGNSHMQDGKYTIFSALLRHSDIKQQAKAVQDNYGNGGSTGALAGADNSYYSGFGKNLQFSRGSISNPYAKVELSWVEAAKRINRLIAEGRYLTRKELDNIPNFERYCVASRIISFYRSMPSVVTRPTKEEISDGLLNPEWTARIVDSMSGDISYLPKDDRNREFCEKAVKTVAEYQAGTFDLFPNFDRDTGLVRVPVEESPQISMFGVMAEKAPTQPMQETPDEKMYREYTQIKEQHPDCLLLYQVGGFYELLGDDAKIVADFFDFKLLTRGNVPMCGIPAHAIADYSEKLYDAGYGIAFADEDNGTRIVSATSPKTTAKPDKREIPKPGNFKITDNHLGEGGTKAKYAANIAAIKTLQIIEAERRYATPDEQELLSRYIGWGGISQAFDSDNVSWSAEYAELKELLSVDEYESARASTLNAHYTSPIVIRAIYDTVERMGFTSGNILEPAMGVGNFFGMLPDSMANSKLYGVELDGITGRIAKQLYPHANITIGGFEKTKTPDSFFDLAVGNVPFGDYGVADKRYDKNHFHIHDYFFAKALDQVRPGGIIAFITSKGTMDKKNSAARKYIAQRAELLGAVRLPNNAFLKNAGTGVTSDIIFLQKRDRPIDVEPDWVHLSLTDDGIPVNSYFAEHPEMILGTMTTEHTQYGHDTTCTPIDGAVLSEQLTAALANVYGEIKTADVEYADEIDERGDIPANPDVKNYSYTVVDNCVYYRENSRMYPIRQPAATLDRIRGMVELRDCTRKLIDLQLLDHSDEEIRDEQLHLGKLYDSYTRRFGLLNDSANKRAFSDDSAYYLLCSLEILDENGKLKRKADMFDKRTIGNRKPVTHVDTAAEALAVSIGERACVDLGFMAQLMGGEDKIEQIVADLQGVIFKDPASGAFQTADEYLSGNVREKLKLAEAAALTVPSLQINVDALKAAQPPDLDASEIFVSLGATWIDKAYIQQFMYETFQTPYNSQAHTRVNYSAHSGVWNISEKRYNSANDIASTVTYGTKRMNAYQILEETLNLHDVRIFDIVRDAEGKEKRVLNNKETTIARQKQESIKQAFRDWIFSDPERRHDLVELYNKNFNSTRPREYDGSHIMFSDMSPEIKLEKHQVDAIARVLYGGNTLLAHEVGAGKTFEMTAAAMESKRLGLCRKSMIAVPNHLTEQWASEFMRLYPAASILVTKKKDFEPANRKKFCARIATGDYDAVIIGHSQFEKIPLSSERQERYLRDKISEIKQALRESDNAERYTVKELEKMLKSYKAKLERLAEGKTRDDVVTFEELGVDRLFVDEAHNFKDL
ncbi:hypothetical protein FACS1894208_06840 [Clostridia bacterium]|nr:hypothetical protein FACS1894208_06840 [Clostridia bacterium]